MLCSFIPYSLLTWTKELNKALFSSVVCSYHFLSTHYYYNPFHDFSSQLLAGLNHGLKYHCFSFPTQNRKIKSTLDTNNTNETINQSKQMNKKSYLKLRDVSIFKFPSWAHMKLIQITNLYKQNHKLEQNKRGPKIRKEMRTMTWLDFWPLGYCQGN